MQSYHLESDEVRCSCGPHESRATTVSFTSNRVRYLFHRCQHCGGEWTERQQVIDRTVPVSIDELLDVHERLVGFEGPLDELLGLKQSA